MTFCTHSHCTTPRRDLDGCYVACLGCGSRIPWGWKDDAMLPPPRLTAPRATAFGDAPEFKAWWRRYVEGGQA